MTNQKTEHSVHENKQEISTSRIHPRNWTIRLRLLVAFFIVMSVPIIGLLIGSISTSQANLALRDANIEAETLGAQRQTVTVEHFLEQDRSDVLTLSELTSLRSLLSAIEADDEEVIAQAKEELSSDFLAFASNNTTFFQVRYIDTSGQEIVRIDSDGQVAIVVPEDELQDKSDRPYFQDTILLTEGEIYTSRLELNVENGLIQVPYAPTIRFATPVYINNELAGIVITNLRAQRLLDQIESDGGQSDMHILVDEEGYYLKNEASPAREWGRDLTTYDLAEGLPEPAFNNNNAANQEEENDSKTAFNLTSDIPGLGFVLDNPSTDTLQINDTFYTYTMLTVDETAGRYWTLITSRPAGEFVTQAANDIPTILGGIAITAIIIGTIVAFYLTGIFVRILASLVETTQQIAGGAFTQRTNIVSADEFGQLGRAFNDMAEQLQQAFVKSREQNTALIKGNRDLAVARKRAEDAAKLKSEFLSTMSHELRTPLNAVIGYTEIQLAGMTGELNDEQKDYQERVLINAEHLLKLINEVLDIAKIEAGRMDILKAPFSIQKFIDELLLQTKGLADEKNLELVTKIDEQLPDVIVGDVARIKQIAINLTSNAIKFTKEGKVSIEIQKQDKDTWALVVNDTGVGIPSHAQEYIFDEFRQVDASSRRTHGGTGLGLAIVRKLALTMDGNVRLHSQVGEGSTFTVSLPLMTEETQETA